MHYLEVMLQGEKIAGDEKRMSRETMWHVQTSRSRLNEIKGIRAMLCNQQEAVTGV